ncbi:LysR substrate-binding domain-containing protein [Phaeobacter sp. B1627]|uniref:LysR substrate-binding domain-containing protein n=1 Tax=Phaeobacter sp. B1627 TaxID=2583809 RepID=UPI00111A8049|nr:LysR substrate-binding domain-containing protein [Phaeobacter sp. B1627]TNJ43306.1 LysR family transcriptional regulator [Phaeobacter sp. B1627]
MEITWLEDLIELDATRNFSVAAAARHITQPAFSRRIKALENWIGTQLIDRSTYPVKLTPAGEIVLENARSLSQDMYRLRDECRDLFSPGADTLSISALHSIALSIYPSYARKLADAVGPFTTRMNATDYYDCIESLSLGRSELAICYSHILGPQYLNSGQFETLTLMQDPLVLVASPQIADRMGHALGTLTEGETLPLVSYSPGCFLGKMQEILTTHYHTKRIGFHTVFENSMSEAVKKMILVGQGIGWLPNSVIRDELRQESLVVLTESTAVLELDVVLVRKSVSGSSLMQKIWDAAEAGTL